MLTAPTRRPIGTVAARRDGLLRETQYPARRHLPRDDERFHNWFQAPKNQRFSAELAIMKPLRVF